MDDSEKRLRTECRYMGQPHSQIMDGHAHDGAHGGNFYHRMFEHAAVGQVEIDLAGGRFLKVNAKFCEITGYSTEELAALSIDDITHPDDVGPGLAARMAFIEGLRSEFSTVKRY